MSTDAPSPPPRRGGSAVGRVWELARQTFRQLVRMKVFYFLIFFALIVIGGSMFVLRYNSPEQELKLLKDFSFFAMTLFTSLLGIVGTAMLIPRDIEDRTIYTILSKPVSRLEYLLGKLFGVLLLIGASLLLMNAFFTVVLYLRQSLMLAEQEAYILGGGNAGDDARQAFAVMAETIRLNGVTWSLQAAVVSIFCKSVVIVSLALMISTFASTTLFTMVTAAVAFFAGHLQADMRAYYESLPATESAARMLAAPLAILLPDFQLFNVVDAAVAGEVLGWADVGKLAGFALGYFAVYTSAAWFLFQDKEI